MSVSTLAEARAIARDVAAVLDALAGATDAEADRALAAGRHEKAITLRRRVEEIARQADRLRGI